MLYSVLNPMEINNDGEHTYSYDVDKISSIALDGNPLISNISYNGANQLTGWTWSDGSAYTKIMIWDIHQILVQKQRQTVDATT